MIETARELAGLGVPVLALLGILVLGLVVKKLYETNRSDRDRCEEELKGLIEKYHEQVEEQIHTLALINSQLDKK